MRTTRIDDPTTAAVQNTLDKGAANAKHAREICERLGIDTRTLRLAVQRLRNEGALICADDSGYYLGESVEEVKRTLDRSDRMAKSILKRNKVFRQQLADIPGQTTVKS